MQVGVSPSPFSASQGFSVAASGGSPPYTTTSLPSPPNPAGVTVTTQGPPAHVDVPSGTPSGTDVFVNVADSSDPPEEVVVGNPVQ